MARFADLHIHTPASDGLHEIEEIVQMAYDAKMGTISTTDHNVFDVETQIKAIELCKKKSIHYIPGIEIGTKCHKYGYDNVHILGYFNPKDIDKIAKGKTVQLANKILEKKTDRNNRLCKLISEILKISDIPKEVGFQRITLARWLEKNGYVQDAHDFLNNVLESPDYDFITYEKLDTEEVMDAIKSDGGEWVYAHPARYKKDKRIVNLAELITFLDECNNERKTKTGFETFGIEVFCPYEKSRHFQGIPKSQIKRIRHQLSQFTKKVGAYHTAGSDFHDKKKKKIGEIKILESYLQKTPLAKYMVH